MPNRVRNVKYPAYGYDNTLYGNRINQISECVDIKSNPNISTSTNQDKLPKTYSFNILLHPRS